MLRKIIKIDEEKCNGCGLCATACHEGAIGIVRGKAKLLREDYCDGLGDCLPACPEDAITFETREAAAYDANAVKNRKNETPPLLQWPVQIKLVPYTAPYYENASLLIAADCTAYAYPDFYNQFAKNKIVLIGCPKLDAVNYAKKLTEIFKKNTIADITVVRMEVPCCGGIEYAVRKAIEESQKDIPFQIITVTVDGKINP